MDILTILMVYTFQIVWTLTTLLKLALAVMWSPRKIFYKKERNVPPACLVDPSYGTHEYIAANGIKFHCVCNGDLDKPLMLFLHGYPEFWYSWRYQLKEFSKDYRTVAIDMRGYGDTDKPVGVDQYNMELLREDIIQLVKILSPSRGCVLVGHDWGGVLGWDAVRYHPELFDKFIVLNCPHPRIFKRHLSTWRQLMKSWYMFMFRTPWLPELLMSLNDYGMMKAMYRGKRAGLRNRANFTDDDLEAFKYTFSQPRALTPPINYIRNIFRVPSGRESPRKPIELPVLLVWGDGDLFLDSDLADQHNDPTICANVTIRHITDCSHWTQQDCPEEVNGYMKEFLRE